MKRDQQFDGDMFSFVWDRLDVAFKKYILNSPQHKHWNKTVDEITSNIKSLLPQDKKDLIMQLGEADSCYSCYIQTMAYLAGFKDALRMQETINDPTNLIHLNWGSPDEKVIADTLS